MTTMLATSSLPETGNLSAKVTETGLVFKTALTREQWLAVGCSLVGHLHRQIAIYDQEMTALKWSIGDWLQHGSYTDKVDMMELTGLSLQSLNRYFEVSKSYLYPTRVRGATWRMHYDAMRLPREEAFELLRKAVAGQWDAIRWSAVVHGRLEAHLKASGVGVDTAPPRQRIPITVGIRCPNCDHIIPNRQIKAQRIVK